MKHRYLIEEQQGQVVTITIDDPENKNAVNPIMNDELIDALDRLENDPSVRVVILTGTGGIFCSGGNIKQMVRRGKSLGSRPRDIRQAVYPHGEGIRRVVLALHQLSKPTIAAINGPAMGSGVGLAAGCDIRLASQTAKIGWVFARRGIVADDASVALLGRTIGYQRTFLWGVTGRTLNANEAREIGFVNEVVAAESLLLTCRQLADEIIQNCPPLTTQLFKLALCHDFDRDLIEAVDFAERAHRISRESDDHTEALRAFADKRPGVWRNR
jgi:enoyl-CoA hydratase/carnithine racemase